MSAVAGLSWRRFFCFFNFFPSLGFRRCDEILA
jgi:hypothetical protein